LSTLIQNTFSKLFKIKNLPKINVYTVLKGKQKLLNLMKSLYMHAKIYNNTKIDVQQEQGLQGGYQACYVKTLRAIWHNVATMAMP
jgi:hypothetical protein